MEKVRKAVAATRTFFSEVLTEMRKTTWPSRQELIESTLVVIASVVLLSAFVGVCDKVLSFVLELLIRTGG